MNRKNDLFEELNIDKEQNDFCSPLDIDIRAVKQNVNAKLDSAYLFGNRKTNFIGTGG